MKIQKEDLELMIDLIRMQYPIYYCETMVDMIQLIWIEFNQEVTPDDVRSYCIESNIDIEDNQSIYKIWQL